MISPSYWPHVVGDSGKALVPTLRPVSLWVTAAAACFPKEGGRGMLPVEAAGNITREVFEDVAHAAQISLQGQELILCLGHLSIGGL